jgi:hypothetical protein
MRSSIPFGKVKKDGGVGKYPALKNKNLTCKRKQKSAGYRKGVPFWHVRIVMEVVSSRMVGSTKSYVVL